jgi:hypothetical protein
MGSLSSRSGGRVVHGSLRALAGVLALVLSLAAIPARAADHQVNAMEMTARESFAAGRYSDALESFAKLYAQTLDPVYLRNIGRCHQKMREPDKAIDAFHDYLAKTKSGKQKISADERDEIQGYIKEMEALRDEQARAAAATPVAPIPAPITPIPSAAATTATTSAPLAAAPALAGAQPAATLTATAPPPEAQEHPIYKRWWFWTIIGVVLVGGAVGVIALSSGGKPACAAPAGSDFRGCM